MKTLKSIIITVALFATCGAVNAAIPTKTNDQPLTENYAVNTYINATTRGILSGINAVLDENVKFSVLENNKVKSYNKQDMMAYLKQNQGVEQDCTTSTAVIESTTENAVVEVDMEYGDHMRTNYVTIVNTDAGWKITDVYSIFK